MLEAVDAAARMELQEEAGAWEATGMETEEREERELAEVVALMNKMREDNELASVAMSSYNRAPIGAGARPSPQGAAKQPWP